MNQRDNQYLVYSGKASIKRSWTFWSLEDGRLPSYATARYHDSSGT